MCVYIHKYHITSALLQISSKLEILVLKHTNTKINPNRLKSMYKIMVFRAIMNVFSPNIPPMA